jgi:hypothetical protein
MADSNETMRTAQEVLMQGIRRIASQLAEGDLRSGSSIVQIAEDLAKLNSGIEALEQAVARDGGDAGSMIA